MYVCITLGIVCYAQTLTRTVKLLLFMTKLTLNVCMLDMKAWLIASPSIFTSVSVDVCAEGRLNDI